MPKLATLRHPLSAEQQDEDCNCDACGRVFDNPIELTILSSEPRQTYKACPYCFSKVDEGPTMEDFRKTMFPSSPQVLTGTLETPQDETPTKSDTAKEEACPYYLGYLRKRPKNSPIPDCCLTCRRMVQCVL